MNFRNVCAVTAVLAFSTAANAVVLVQTSDPGFYNNSVGRLLDGTNGGESGPFPISNDSRLTFPQAPDLSAASGPLGNWLTNPGNLNSNWSFVAEIPNRWTPRDEVAVIYRFDTLGATNVMAEFGVDNGIFAWLDGAYLFGARAPGSVTLGEYEISLGDLDAGSHYLQLLLEDHGSANGYNVNITADTFIPGSPTSPVNDVFEPMTLGLFGLGFAGLGLAAWRRGKGAILANRFMA